MEKTMKVFQYGSTWLRFDSHLHTKADKEFKYSGDENQFISQYVQKLKEAGISVGVITNHNKFDLNEYKALKKAAIKEEIYLLPGVELSVNDGRNGIHILIVFHPEKWVENSNNFIDHFIVECFAGQHNYQNENGKSNFGLIDTLKKLENYKRDYFVILAHVEQRSGFFEELGGGRVTDICSDPIFKKRVVALQKVRSRDKIKIWEKQWGCEPLALVEGSDPKSLDEIGKGDRVSYLKVGDFNFEAIYFALKNKELRVSDNKINPNNAYIKSISFEGSGCKLNGVTINFSSSLNSIIGIRGSGKSSVIEAIRYALGIPFGSSAQDIEYKNNLVKELLGSAGKITLIAIDKQGNEYVISRVFGHSVEVRKDGQLLNININSMLNMPLYFGQKDLSGRNEKFESDLIEKLVGTKTKEIKEQIILKQQEIRVLLQQIKKYESIEEKEKEVRQKIEELKIRIEEFKKYQIEEKLKREIDFNKDKTHLKVAKEKLTSFLDNFKEFLSQYSDDFFDSIKKYESKENKEIFNELFKKIDKAKEYFLNLTKIICDYSDNLKDIDLLEKELTQKYETFKEEFLKIQREINIPNLRTDDFINYTKTLQTQEIFLTEIEKSKKQKEELSKKIQTQLSELNELYRKEFEVIKREIDRINEQQKFVRLEIEFKGDKKSFEEFLKTIFSGSRLNSGDYQKLIAFADGVEIYKNIDQIEFGGDKKLIFKEKLNSKLPDLLTYQVPNKIKIYYKDKELSHYSLGQRASALIIFILTQKENDIIIIDQPEDDLDNQTIYNEVIKELLKFKNQTQFIFATHNANIPVLGDSEQVIVCEYGENKISIEHGSIDNHSVQEKIISIMEGGKEAFTKRREVYNLWKA